MGSCTSKTDNQEVKSIKQIPNKDPLEKEAHSSQPSDRQGGHNSEKTPKKYTIEITPEESKRRKSKKKLTVLTSNEDNYEQMKNEFNEMSLIRQASLGKQEQGSIIILKKPAIYGGKISNNIQNDFADKLISAEGDTKNNSLAENNIWVSCKKGLKPESPNQDDFVVVVDSNSILLGVFDGHGTHGHECSNFVHKSFPKTLLNHPNWQVNPLNALQESFQMVHNELVHYCNNNTRFDCTLSGTTSTLLYVKDRKLYMAHAGDSRAVLCRRVNNKITAVELTRDHKPTLRDEMERIIKAGGEVKRLEDDIPHRVFIRGKSYPGIAMSRTIGDLLAQTVGVTYMPEVNEMDLEDTDEFVIACSDGVWEFVSSQEAIDEISKYNKNPSKAAEALAVLAWNKWVSNEEDIVDDITVVLAYLNK